MITSFFIVLGIVLFIGPVLLTIISFLLFKNPVHLINCLLYYETKLLKPEENKILHQLIEHANGNKIFVWLVFLFLSMNIVYAYSLILFVIDQICLNSKLWKEDHGKRN